MNDLKRFERPSNTDFPSARPSGTSESVLDVAAPTCGSKIPARADVPSPNSAHRGGSFRPAGAGADRTRRGLTARGGRKESPRGTISGQRVGFRDIARRPGALRLASAASRQ
jgi:hypothetical protein